jgi:hypothetical protein
MSAIIGQVLPFLSQEHQQQVATAVERAKQVTMSDLNNVVAAGGAPGASVAPAGGPAGARPDMIRLMQLHAQAQAGQAGLAGLAGLQNGGGLPPGLAGLPPGALAQSLGLQAAGLPPGFSLPSSMPSSLLSSLPTSLASLMGPNPIHPALGMLKPQLPQEPKREEDVRKSLSESNGMLSLPSSPWPLRHCM